MAAGLTRIILHWSAGTGLVSALDRSHYHYIIGADGGVASGDHEPEANLGTLVSGRYAAHTLNCNSGSIGVALAAMGGAVERPFSAGRYPISELQVDVLIALCASLSVRYGIPVERPRILSHAEVSPTLGIAQRGKWDISWLPGMAAPGDPVEVGDIIRQRIRDEIEAASGSAPVQAVPATIRIGDRGADVQRLQRALGIAVDGIFGRQTQSTLADWQADHGLVADGICGPATWTTLISKGL